ncbi:hypothetical protein QAD02_011001 [Eretmocerus hayati]|uniref:Uncharacterized protein n=1 Tax=Eretmocerus hayati TaxID=131215 RepID=A0ACC2NVJ5_9HYME|nr:hypothetical protein QAD02_011001 [Eretmocerus hayati]
MSMKLDVEFSQDDGLLPLGPLCHKYRIGYMSRYYRIPPPSEETLGERRSTGMGDLPNRQPLTQVPDKYGLDPAACIYSCFIYPYSVESFSNSELAVLSVMIPR